MARTYYDVLGIPQRATKNEIKAAFREKAKLVHPDTVQAQTANLNSYAAERLKATLEQDFRELTEAYEVLSDSQKRKEYDDFLQQLQAASVPPPVTPPASTPPGINFCTVCGTRLAGNDCAACAKRQSGDVVSPLVAFLWSLGSVIAFIFIVILAPQIWDSDTCVGMLIILGFIIAIFRRKLWRGVKRLRNTHPKIAWLAIEVAALVVLSLVVGAFNKPPAKTAATSTQPQTANIVPVKPPDCREMVVTHNVDIGPHTYSVGRHVCVTTYSNGRYFSPQNNEWFSESNLGPMKSVDQGAPTRVDAKPKPQATTALAKSQQEPLANLPLHWTFAKTSNAIDVWLDRHSLYEKATFSARTKTDDLFKRETSCIVARGESFPWTGTCTYNYFWSDSSKVFDTAPTCTVTAVEKITSISMTDITGQSQKINSTPLQLTPSRCPIAGTEYGEFEVVPADKSEPQDKPAPMTNLYRASSEPQIAKPEPQITRQEPQAPCSEMVIVKSNYVLAINRPYPTSYSREAIDTANYHVGDRVTVTTRRNGRYFHPPTSYSDGVWFNASDLVCPEKP